MFRLALFLAIAATNANAESDLCKNAKAAEKAFNVLYSGMTDAALVCRNKRSTECRIANKARKDFNDTQNGMGLVAMQFARKQACKD